jgi:hypothetical protein
MFIYNQTGSSSAFTPKQRLTGICCCEERLGGQVASVGVAEIAVVGTEEDG